MDMDSLNSSLTLRGVDGHQGALTTRTLVGMIQYFSKVNGGM